MKCMAQSRKDFISNVNCVKEARETKYWLLLPETIGLVNLNYKAELLKIEHIINVFKKMVKTSQQTFPDK